MSAGTESATGPTLGSCCTHEISLHNRCIKYQHIQVCTQSHSLYLQIPHYAVLLVPQLAAVRGLRETQPPSVGMVNVLRRGMEDATIFCRVRGEAAMALAFGAGTEHNGEEL